MENLYIYDDSNQKRIAIGGFDFDGNILAPDTITYVIDRETGEEIEIVAHILDQNPSLINGDNAKYQWKDDIIESLIHFRDYHSDKRHRGPDQLQIDTIKALEKGAFSPSLESLKNTFLIPARLFAIITARGHEPGNIIRVLWMINETILTEYEKKIQYENICSIHSVLRKTGIKISRDQALRYYFEQIVGCYPVSNVHTAKYLDMSQIGSMSTRKTLAMKHYMKEITNTILTTPELRALPKSIGFSDDAVSNIISMLSFFQGRKGRNKHDNDIINLYFTGKQEDIGKIIVPQSHIEHRENMAVIRI